MFCPLKNTGESERKQLIQGVYDGSLLTVLENEIIAGKATESASPPPQPTPVQLRLYYLSDRVFESVVFRARRIAGALHSGLWLGVLDAAQITAVVSQHYDEAELYRTAAHNLHGFWPYEKELVRDHFSGCRSVIVAAAGAGREMLALAQAGVLVDGFECNPRLVAACKEFLIQAGISGRILQAAPDEVPEGLGEYDAGIVGFGAFAHIVGRARRVSFLRDLKAHLRPGAPLLLSVGRRAELSQYHAWIYHLANAIRTLRRSVDAIELGDDLLDCFSHRFVKSELQAELQDAGLNMLAYVETNEIYAVAQA